MLRARLPHSAAAVTVVLTLSVASSGAAAAAPPVAPVVPVPAPGQQSLFAGVDRAHYAWRSWQAQFGNAAPSSEDAQRLTWPDATLRTITAMGRASAPAFGTFSTSVDPWSGSLASETFESTGTSSRWLLAAANREWAIRTADEWVDTGQQLVARDVTGRVVSARRFPKGRVPRAIVPGHRGPLVVTDSRSAVRLLDARLRSTSVLRLSKRHSPIGAVVSGAQPLADGSVIVAVSRSVTDTRSRSLLVRFRPGQRPRVIWRGAQIGQLYRLGDGVAGLTDGQRWVSIDDRGRVTSRRWGAGRPSALARCSANDLWWRGTTLATNGRLMIGMACQTASQSTGYAVEVGLDGVTRAAYDLAPTAATEPAEGNGARLVGADAPLADGALPFPTSWSVGEDVVTGWSSWQPAGSAAPTRGRVSVSLPRRAGSGRTAIVAVTCRGRFGELCSGVAELRDRGKLVGSQRYALPARPGRLAAKDRFRVDLSSDVAAGDLTLTAVRLPDRQPLDPPRPPWDRSEPY